MSQKCNVAIIGAGVAGISAASLLSSSGVPNICVFESLKRCGGRLDFVQLNDNITVNLGANWMAGLKNPILELLRKDKSVTIFKDFTTEKNIQVLDEKYNDITEEHRSHLKSWADAHEVLAELDEPELISLDAALTVMGFTYRKIFSVYVGMPP